MLTLPHFSQTVLSIPGVRTVTVFSCAHTARVFLLANNLKPPWRLSSVRILSLFVRNAYESPDSTSVPHYLGN